MTKMRVTSLIFLNYSFQLMLNKPKGGKNLTRSLCRLGTS